MNIVSKVKKVKLGKSKYQHKHLPFYEVYRDGIYIGINNGVMTARELFLGYENDSEFLLSDEYGESGFELHIPKIPFKYWYMIWSFYRDVVKEYGTEAAVIVYYNNKSYTLNDIPSDLVKEYGKGLYVDDQYVLYVPKQENTVTSTKYYGDELNTWLKDNLDIILDTHSHGRMASFFSATDDKNEQFFQFYAVYGNVGSSNTFILRYYFQAMWKEVAMHELFEEGTIPLGDEGESTYPREWLENCTFGGSALDTVDYFGDELYEEYDEFFYEEVDEEFIGSREG